MNSASKVSRVKGVRFQGCRLWGCRLFRVSGFLGGGGGVQCSCVIPAVVLAGSWDLVSKVISTFIGAISLYSCSYLTDSPNY